MAEPADAVAVVAGNASIGDQAVDIGIGSEQDRSVGDTAVAIRRDERTAARIAADLFQPITKGLEIIPVARTAIECLVAAVADIGVE